MHRFSSSQFDPATLPPLPPPTPPSYSTIPSHNITVQYKNNSVKFTNWNAAPNYSNIKRKSDERYKIPYAAWFSNVADSERPPHIPPVSYW